MSTSETSSAGWFQERLRTSAEDFEWAVRNVPSERWHASPPGPLEGFSLGEWTVARHVHHLAFYDEYIAIPTMRQWLGEPFVSLVDAAENMEHVSFEQGAPLEARLCHFRALRETQIALLAEIGDAALDEPREILWSQVTGRPIPLRWAVSKTFQHTTEHVHNVLSLALFWDIVAGYLATQADAGQP